MTGEDIRANICGIIVLIVLIFVLFALCTVKAPASSVNSSFFPPTATNIVSVDGIWYTFILDDTVWYVRDLNGKPVYLRGPAE